MTTKFYGLFLCVFLLGTAGCDSSETTATDAGPGDTDGGSSTQGFTTCGDLTCQPGQSCINDIVCEDGCLSTVNCAADQICDTSDPDLTTGRFRCLNVAPTPDAGSTPDAGPTPDIDSGPTPIVDAGATAPDPDCAAIVDRSIECGELLESERAAFQTQCETVLPPAQVEATLRCINLAGADCAQVLSCLE